MPNDNQKSPEAEREALRAFFISHYNEIYQFAIACNMTIERWPHNTNQWELCFTPPQGGSASITICPISRGTFKLYTAWYVDDYDAATRSVKHWESPTHRENEVQLAELLREALSDMLKWRLGDWSLVSKEPPRAQRYSREQWENMQVHWPKVRPPGDAG